MSYYDDYTEKRRFNKTALIIAFWFMCFGIGQVDAVRVQINDVPGIISNLTVTGDLSVEKLSDPSLVLDNTDTDVGAGQFGSTIEFHSNDASSTAGIHAYIRTIMNTAGDADMVFGTGDQSTPVERLRITEAGVKIFGPGTKHDGFITEPSAEVQTTDATVTTLDSITLLDENGYLVTAKVVARQSDGTTGIYHLTVGAKRVSAGSAVLVGTPVSLNTAEDEASWDCTFTVSGNDLRLSVTGEAATTIEWAGHLEYENMSN